MSEDGRALDAPGDGRALDAPGDVSVATGDDPAEAIAAYRAALPPGTLEAIRMDPLDRLGVPAVCLTYWPARGPGNGGNGYGTDEGEATRGALGELTEVVSAHDALARLPRRRDSYRALAAARGPRAVLDPLAACLDAGAPYGPDRPLQWVEARRLATGEPVLVPLEFAACQETDLDPGERDGLVTPITNGLGAGLSREHALCHGLLELIQRDGNSVAYRALAGGATLDLDEVRDPEARALLRRYDEAGVAVLAKLASTEFGLTNLYVVGADRDGAPPGPPGAALMAAACGEAADPDRERALRKALLEFAMARARLPFTHGPLELAAGLAPPGYLDRFLGQPLDREEPRALRAMGAWLGRDRAGMRALLADTVLRADEGARTPFSALPGAGGAATASARARLDLVAGRLADAGFDILYVDISPDPARTGAGVHAVKAIVPGLEVETMSYGRIGERNARKLLGRGGGLVGQGDPPPGARPIRLTEEAEARLGGPAWLDVDAVARAVGPLYPLYREPGRHSAQLARRAGLL